MTLGNKVKKRHEELGISQSKLAEMTKISQPGISRLQNDRYTPSSPFGSSTCKSIENIYRRTFVHE